MNKQEVYVYKLLVNLAKREDNTITYGDLAKSINKEFGSKIIALRVIGILDSINKAVFIKSGGGPLISALVINKARGMPGDGFFDLAKFLYKDNDKSKYKLICKDKNKFWDNEINEARTHKFLKSI